jgi:fimbrial chaperone protein
MLFDRLIISYCFKCPTAAVVGALLGIAVILPSKEVNAGALQIWPIEIFLDSQSDVVQVNVNNTSSTDTFVQAMVVLWPSSEGPISYEPTQDVMVSPPIFDLPANASQTVRLALRKSLPEDSESTYRLVVTELAKTAGLVPNTLNVAVNMNMPVFVTPPSATAQPSWSLANTDFEGQYLVMTNQGNAHLNIKRIALLGGQDREPLFESENGGYVLAGEEKRWALKDALARLKGPIALKAETTNGPIEALVELPDS